MFLHSLLMQNTKNTHQTRKDGTKGLSKKSPWYQRALEVLLLLWKQPATTATSKATAGSGVAPPAAGRLRKSSSLNVAASFTRVCLCAPISSYNEVFQADVAPRRSYSYPRGSSASAASSPLVAPPAGPAEQQRGRAPGESGRRVFRGKSLTDDILMRRFVVDEEATRRRNEMEVVRRRNATAARRRRIGPSPLSRMALPESETETETEPEAQAEAGHSQGD